MQGQKSAIGSLPESLGFDHGSTSSEAGIDQHFCWTNMRNSASNRLSDYISPNNTGVTFLNSTSPEGQNLSGWSMGEPSSSAVQNQLSHNEQKAEHSWASSLSARDGPILEDQQYAPASGLSLNDVNVNLSSNQIARGTLFLQSSSSDSFSQDLNINAGFEGQGVDDCQIVECPLVFRSGSSENSRVQSGSSSSNPFGLQSGEYMEENDGSRIGYSLDGRRLSCKRKAIEGNIGQSSGSGSSNYFQHAEGSVWHAVPARRNTGSSLTISAPSESTIGVSQQEQVNPRLGLGVGGIASEIPPALSAAGSAESSHRNIRLRINSSHQHDSISTNVFAAGSAVGPSNVSSSHQSSRLLPLHNSLDLRSSMVTDSASPQGVSLLPHVPAMHQNPQSSRRNRSSSSRPCSSPSFPIAAERDTASHDESSSRSIPRNISEHPIFVPASGMRNSAQNPVNWSLPGGNISIAGNAAASSRTRSGSTSGVHQSSGPNWVPHRNSPQYPRRLSEFVRRSLLSSSGPESGGQTSNISPPRSGTSSSSQEMPPSSGDQGHHLSHSRSAMLLDRRIDGAFGIPYSLRTLAAANEGRSRLVSEIRNVLDLMRRGEGLRFEDVMILNQSVFFGGMGDIHDRHRDMRLDVDNMSYEELLALEERIGNVNTGLSELTISSCLKQSKYALVKTDQEDAEPCCICQEEYNDEDVLGKLECGHDFHVDCIKQWLTHKNLCPICKTTAMSTREKP